jgi:hypothetical protein
VARGYVNSPTRVWFQGEGQIDCKIQEVKDALQNHGEHYVEIISLMPGLNSVELVEQGDDFFTITTNEGRMTRTNLAKRIGPDSNAVESDEVYQAGGLLTVKSHYLDEFTARDTGVAHHTVISNLEAPGLLGFFYRVFGKTKTGNALLASYKTYFEQRREP